MSRGASWLAAIALAATFITSTAWQAAMADVPQGNNDGYTIHPIPASRLLYRGDPAPRVDDGVHDAKGVRMYRFPNQTKLWNHPVGQAQWGLRNLSAYLDTGDRFYLDRARANAQRNLDRKVVSRGAWWFPYDFDAVRCTGRPTMEAPWYSGMSQGLLLSLFVRLHEVTDEAKWREAADRTFASLTLPPKVGVPWATWVDPDGYLWLEEYPERKRTAGERVMNGHVYAMLGVYDYWRLTNSAVATSTLKAGATTVRRYLPSPFRVPNWASRYSLGCPHSAFGYHVVHTDQALRLYEITHASVFADYASVLRADFPARGVSGPVRFNAGSHTGYKFDGSGRITGNKSIKLTKASNAPTNKRIRIKGRGIYYVITAGALRGYLVPEQYPSRILLGTYVEHRYNPKRTLTFKPGTYTAYAYDSKGTIVRTRVATLTKASNAPLGATAMVNGRLSYLVTAGYFKGWWLPDNSGLSAR
jgi:hypothetical protein